MAKHAQTQAEASASQRDRRKLSRLVLTGFMGAGKSTIGPLLAASFGWRFLDLDGVIEEAHQKTVPQIFREEGEAAFRRHERQALAGLRTEHQIVLALGGGSLEHPDTLASLLEEQSTCLVFLEAPLSELLSRIREKDAHAAGSPEPDPRKKADRPLNTSGTRTLTGETPRARPLLTRPDELEARYQRRLSGYRSAHITVLTSGMRPEEVAERVLAEVRRRWITARKATRQNDQPR